MPVEVRKGEHETSQSLLRRFTKAVQQSGVLLRAREVRFVSQSKSKQMTKRAALRKVNSRLEYKKLLKLGKAPVRKKR